MRSGKGEQGGRMVGLAILGDDSERSFSKGAFEKPQAAEIHEEEIDEN
jgi:hypothetical protein